MSGNPPQRSAAHIGVRLTQLELAMNEVLEEMRLDED